MNKLISFVLVGMFFSYESFSQILIKEKDNEVSALIIEEQFDKVFKRKISFKELDKKDNYIDEIIKKGLDIEIGIIDFLTSKFSVQSMEGLIDDIKNNKKIEKIANYLFEQINYTKKKIENELTKNKNRY